MPYEILISLKDPHERYERFACDLKVLILTQITSLLKTEVLNHHVMLFLCYVILCYVYVVLCYVMLGYVKAGRLLYRFSA